MQVLKKFGALLILLFIWSSLLYAQNNTDCGNSPIIKSNEKIDPVDFIHNHLLNRSSNIVNPDCIEPVVVKKTSNSKSKKPLSKVKETVIQQPEKLVNEKARTLIAAKEDSKKQGVNTSDKLLNNNTLTNISSTETSIDLVSSRLVSKPLSPKKEEASISSIMMEWVKDKYSCMIDVLPNQISNVMLYRFIDEWYGVKYRMGGTTKKGVDCSAFVQTLYKYVFGLDLLRTACLQFNSSELIKEPSELQEGDLVFFKVKSSRISHVGVYLRNNFFVHSASSKGVSIAKLTSQYWSKYFVGGGRIKQ